MCRSNGHEKHARVSISVASLHMVQMNYPELTGAILLFCCLSGKLWYLQHSCVGDTIVNTLRPRQDGRHFADDIFKCIFLNENVWIPIKISLKLVSKGPINNIPAMVQIMAWRRPGDKPLSEPMVVSLLMHICVARPQWVNYGISNTVVLEIL